MLGLFFPANYARLHGLFKRLVVVCNVFAILGMELDQSLMQGCRDLQQTLGVCMQVWIALWMDIP